MIASKATAVRADVRLERVLPWLLAATCLSILGALYAALVYAPEEATMGQVQRIFYFHVPSAWVAFLAYFVVFVGGVAYLRTRRAGWDIIARCSAEIGVLFTTIALITGSLWAKPVWGTWWTWEPRLTVTLVLWLIYVGYLLLRSAIPQPEQRAVFASVLGIVGFIDVPIVFGSVRWWRTVHPVVMDSGGFDLARPMLIALLVSLAAFTIVYLTLLLVRTSLERSKEDLERARRAVGLYEGEEF
jgi:heme exporter protein C